MEPQSRRSLTCNLHIVFHPNPLMLRTASTSQEIKARRDKAVRTWMQTTVEWLEKASRLQPSLWIQTNSTSIRPLKRWVSTQNSANSQTRYDLWQPVCMLGIAAKEPNSTFLENSLWCPTISYIQIRSIRPCSAVEVTASSSCHAMHTTNWHRTIVTRTLFTISPKESMNSRATMQD